MSFELGAIKTRQDHYPSGAKTRHRAEINRRVNRANAFARALTVSRERNRRDPICRGRSNGAAINPDPLVVARLFRSDTFQLLTRALVEIPLAADKPRESASKAQPSRPRAQFRNVVRTLPRDEY